MSITALYPVLAAATLDAAVGGAWGAAGTLALAAIVIQLASRRWPSE